MLVGAVGHRSGWRRALAVAIALAGWSVASPAHAGVTVWADGSWHDHAGEYVTTWPGEDWFDGLWVCWQQNGESVTEAGMSELDANGEPIDPWSWPESGPGTSGCEGSTSAVLTAQLPEGAH